MKNKLSILKADSAPEVHGRENYGHYHDKNHLIHIWYGKPVIKQYDRLARAARFCKKREKSNEICTEL